MSGNTFGRIFRLTTYGESHGKGLGGIVDGCPAGLALSEADIQNELDARRPGGTAGGAASTARSEKDRVRLLSGVFHGLTTGTPIAFHVENEDQRSADYSPMADVLRPGHADLGFYAKFGLRDHRGGGRSSGRETLSRVAGGAIAKVFLASLGISVRAYTLELGGVAAPLSDISGAASRPYFAPDAAVVELWNERVRKIKAQGDSIGGLVRVEAFGLPAGLGEPVFDKLDARLAYALMSVGAIKGVEVGRGFAAARLLGCENNDPCVPSRGGCGVITTQQNPTPVNASAAPENGARPCTALAKRSESPQALEGRPHLKFGKGAGNPKSAGRNLGAIACGPPDNPEDSADPLLSPQNRYVPACGLLPCGAAYAFESNNAGGVLGGMSTGAPLVLTVAVKPIPSISKEQHTISVNGDATRITVGGRHDISAIPRIVPVLKSMVLLTLADFVMLQRRLG